MPFCWVLMNSHIQLATKRTVVSSEPSQVTKLLIAQSTRRRHLHGLQLLFLVQYFFHVFWFYQIKQPGNTINTSSNWSWVYMITKDLRAPIGLFSTLKTYFKYGWRRPINDKISCVCNHGSVTNTTFQLQFVRRPLSNYMFLFQFGARPSPGVSNYPCRVG